MKENFDLDPQETKEWIEALNSVLSMDGKDRASYILNKLNTLVGGSSASVGFSGGVTTPEINTIPVSEQPTFPGDLELEARIMNICRWNTMAIVTKANKKNDGIGGHIATYTSSATLYEVGYNHFFKGPKKDGEHGDQIFVQGHASPGIYARAYLEGILTEKQLDNFRRELVEEGGLPSYPHPRLLKNFWQFPTVSMGLGPVLAVFVARFNRYLSNRKIKDTSNSHVWAYLGDGELSEPEIYGSLPIATREKLDNLIFVVNCNLQRLDGPVYGNGSIVKETEGMFRGAGWNVIKVVWSSAWDKVFEKDVNGVMATILESIPDGDLQTLPLKTPFEIREILGKTPEAKELINLMSDTELANLDWGGHDIRKIYAAYHRATTQKNGRPTAIIVRTIKGYGMGSSGAAVNTAHSQKKMSEDSSKEFLHAKGIEMSEADIKAFKFYHPGKNSKELKHIEAIRQKQGGFIPRRIEFEEAEKLPKLDATLFDKFNAGGGSEREYSTTKSYVQILSALMRDKAIANSVVPILCDEARTFGMEGLFGQHGIYNPLGQIYTPSDAKTMMPYKEKVDGKILQEGINEAGSLASFISVGASYSYQGVPMIPFYAYYSMFGFQRVGDSIWQALDMKTKGFLMGGTAGRTTLNGEGLQHEDGHSVVIASTFPKIRTFDPAFEYEMASVIKDGIDRMYYKGQDLLYYITMYNEDINHPAKPKHVTDTDINSGLYLYEKGSDKPDVNLISGGIIFKETLAAKEILTKQFKLKVNIYSAPSFKAVRDEAMSIERERLLNPDKKLESYVEKLLKGQTAPFVAATDYVREWSELIRKWVPATYVTLGTDGFGHSSSREELRRHFEVDKEHIAYGALYSMFLDGKFSLEDLKKAQKTLKIDPKKASGMDDILL